MIGTLLFTGFAVADSSKFSEEFILDTSVTQDVEVSIAVDHPEVDYAFVDGDSKLVFIEDDGTIVDTYGTSQDINDLSYNAKEEVFAILDMGGTVRTIEVSSGDASVINTEDVQDAGDISRSYVVMVEPIDQDTVLILDQELNHELYIYDITTGSVIDDENFVDSPPSNGATMVYNWDDEEVWVTEEANTIAVFDTSGNSLSQIDGYPIGTDTHYRGYYAHESVYYYYDGDIMKDGSPVLDIDTEHPQDGWHSWSVSLDQEDRFLFPQGGGFGDEGIFLFDDTGLIDEWENREATDSHQGSYDTEQFRDMALTGTDDDFQFLFGEGDFDEDDKAILGRYGIAHIVSSVSPSDGEEFTWDTDSVDLTVDVDYADGEDDAELEWVVDGTVEETRTVSSGGQETFSFSGIDSGEEYEWYVEETTFGDTTETRTFSLEEEPEPELQISRLDDNSPVAEGQDLEVDYEVENVGQADGEADAWLIVEGQEEDRITHNLNTGETKQDTFTYTTSQTGEFDYWIETEDDSDLETEESREFNEDSSDDSDGILAGGWTTDSPEGYYHDNGNIHDNFQLEEGETREYIIDEAGSGADAHWMLSDAPQTSWKSGSGVDNEIYGSGSLDSYSSELNRIEVEWSGDTVSYEIFDEEEGGNQITSDSADVSGEDEIYFSNYEWAGGSGDNSLRLIQIGGGEDPYTFEVEDVLEPTIDAVSPADNENFDPDTQEVGWTVDVDLDGADSVEVNWMLGGLEQTVLESRTVSTSGEHTYDYDIVGLSDTSISWNAEVELDGNVEDTTDTRTFGISHWDIALDNFQPPDSHTIDYDTEEDFSVDVTTPYDADTYISETDENFVYALRFDGDPTPVRQVDFFSEGTISEAVNPMDEGIDVGQNFEFDIEIFLDDDAEQTETRTASVDEPNLDVSLDQPVDGESFVWDTEDVTHSFDVTGEGQTINYDLKRDGVIEESGTVSNDGVSSVDHTLPVDTETSYNWEVDINDDWNSASSEQRTYSIDAPPSITFTDITPDRQQSAEEVTFDLEHDNVEDVDRAEIFYPREDFSDVEEDLNEVESGVWTLDHIIPSGTETGTYDVEFRIYSGGEVADTQNEVLEVDNEPPKLSTSFDSEVRFSGFDEDYIETTVYFNESFEELGSVDVSTVETGFQDSASANEWTEGIPEGDEWNFNEFYYETSEFDGDEIVVVEHRFEVTGDWETEETGIVEYSDDLGNEDEFQNSFDVDTVPPSLDNFEATNLDHPDKDRYVEGDEIEFEIEATDFSDVTSVEFENDAFASTITASQDGDVWSGTRTVTTENTEALESQDVTVTAEDDFANTVSESYGSGLEQAPSVELVSQTISVDQDIVDHSFTTNTQIESGEVGVYGEFRDVSEYSESETQDGFQYTATFTEGEQGYWRDRNDNNLDVTDIWSQNLQEKVIPHLVDVEAPTVEPTFAGSFESDTEPRGEIVNEHIRIIDTNVSDNVALEEVTVSVNGETFVQESFPLEPTEEDALDGTGDTIIYGEELNLSDMDDSDVIEENEVNTVTIEATDHEGNHTSSETEVYVIGELPVENVEWSFSQYNRDYGQTNDLEITFDQVEFDWFFRSYDVDIALKKDDTPVEYPRYHNLDSGVADQTVPDNGGDVLYRPMTFGSSLEERGGLRFHVEQEGGTPLSNILYEDFELTEEAGDSYAPYEVIENENNVTHVWKLDWDDRLLEKDEYDAEITGVLQVEESAHDNEETIEESFRLDEVIDFKKSRAISDTEELSTEFKFRSRDNLTLNQLEVERVVSDEFIEIQGYRYEYDGETEEFVFQEEVDRLEPRTWNDLEEDPVDGDEEWRFDFTNTHPDWTVSVYSRGGVGLVGDTGNDDIRMEVATLSTGSTSDEEVFDGGSSVSTSDYETVFEYRNSVFDEEDVELENSTNFFSNRSTYSTGEIEDLRRGEMKVRFNLQDDTGNINRIERPFEIRENTFEGNFYQFFDNRMAWSDAHTGLALAGITIVGGVVIINLWLGGLMAALYGIGSSVLWLFSGFLPLSVNLLLAVLLAGGITIVAKKVIS